MRFPGWLAMALADGLAPAFTRWAINQERRILKEGVALTPDLLEFARTIGLSSAGAVRVLIVSPIPLPVPDWLMRLAEKSRLPVFAPGGMTLGNGIYLLPGQENSLRHEMIHVLQYERLGGTMAFFRRYIFECLSQGYHDAPLEAEAREGA